MPAAIRTHPNIPDHDVLRKIGGGAYGEVWMARRVTGAMRAVKVLWREDFDDERTFEREFEGILKFEPISRDHPGLVNILHVGRSPDGVSFYYYVMELGDDIHTGQEINPVEYEARTLRADGTVGVRLDTDLPLPRPLDDLKIEPRWLELIAALEACEFKGLTAEVKKEAAALGVVLPASALKKPAAPAKAVESEKPAPERPQQGELF